MATEPGKMRFRIKHHDAPEVFQTFRIYREANGGRKVPIYSAEIGIQSLYYARWIIVQSSKVFLEVQLSRNGKPFLATDHYGRRLVNIWIQEKEDVRTSILVM